VRPVLLAAAFAVLLAVALVLLLLPRSPAPANPAPPLPDATALTVDETPVPFRAVSVFLARERSDIVAQAQASGADVAAAGFWDTPIRGTTPAQSLVDRAEASVVRLQIELDAAEHAGVSAPHTYADLVQAWTAENDRRAAALRAGEPVYGPPSLSESDFIDYFLGALRQEVSEALASAGAIDGSATAVQSYRGEHPEAADAPEEAVRLSALEEQYTSIVDASVAAADVSPAPALGDLAHAPCVAAGAC